MEEIERTVQELKDILNEIPDPREVANVRSSADQILPGLYLGDINAAKNEGFLRSGAVGSIVNTAAPTLTTTAKGGQGGWLDERLYKKLQIKCLNLPLIDHASTDISTYFEHTAEFIGKSVDNGVLVHCEMGVSRSSTCVIAYLMLKHNMTVHNATRLVRKHRQIRPNDGFLRQLAELDQRLQQTVLAAR